MADPFSPNFADIFGAQSDFADMVQRAFDGGFKFERLNGIPQAKKCDSREELGAWFRAFARACKDG